MAEPFVGEIRNFAFAIVPTGWAQCQGQLMQVQTNQALFSLLGNRYGGNGTSNFALPDLRGRVPIHFSNAILQGAIGGSENTAVTVANLPLHTHNLLAVSTPATSKPPANDYLASGSTSVHQFYAPATGTTVVLDPSVVVSAGSSQPYSNMQPFLVTNFCIALTGIYPPRQ